MLRDHDYSHNHATTVAAASRVGIFVQPAGIVTMAPGGISVDVKRPAQSRSLLRTIAENMEIDPVAGSVEEDGTPIVISQRIFGFALSGVEMCLVGR